MGCTQSNAAVASTTPRYAELKHIHTGTNPNSKYDNSAYPQAPNSNKSMNTAKTMTTTNSTSVNTNSNGAASLLSPRIVPALSYEIDDDEEIDDDYEVTTECDDESVQSMLLNSGRSKASYSFFPENSQHPRPSNGSPSYRMIDEMSTEDNNDTNHDCRTYEDVPNMDESLSSSSNNEIDPPVPCTILTVRKHYSTKSKTAVDSDELHVTSTSDDSSNQYHTRMLSIHQEQQKRLLSLMTTLLPWTHAIVIRKQRHIQVRQMMITSLLWFSMLLWPAMTNQFHRHSTNTTTRTRNPTSLFRR
jgi:hypothetical protein